MSIHVKLDSSYITNLPTTTIQDLSRLSRVFGVHERENPATYNSNIYKDLFVIIENNYMRTL